MISRRILINLVVFFLVALALVVYGAFTIFGFSLHPARHDYVELPSAGGLRSGFTVSLNGVPIGTVSDVKLTGAGVRATLRIDHGVTIPGDVRARVLRASAVGEQRVDLKPAGDGKVAPLPDNSTIPLGTDPLPPDVSKVIDTVTNLVKKLPTDQLNQLLGETAAGFSGRADDIRSIIASLTRFDQEFLAHQQGFTQLLDSSPAVLDAFTQSAGQLKSALDNTLVLAKLLDARRYDLVQLFVDGTRLGQVGNKVVLDNRTNLTCLLSDAADLTDFLQGQNLANLATGLTLNRQFFGLVDIIAKKGFARDLGLNAPTRDDQLWLRTRLILPPGNPAPSRYNPQIPIPATKPGAACRNVYGNGVGPASQAGYTGPIGGSVISPPTAAQAEAPPAALTGPASASNAAPAGLTSPEATWPTTAASHAPHGLPLYQLLLLIALGAAAFGLILVVTPYARHRQRTR